MKELIVALDLELNQPSGRVVQIGAVLGNVRTGEVLSQFALKVNPGEPFSLRIAEAARSMGDDEFAGADGSV